IPFLLLFLATLTVKHPFYLAGALLLFCGTVAELVTSRRIKIKVPYCRTHAALWTIGTIIFRAGLAILAAFVAALSIIGILEIQVPPAVMQYGVVMGSIALLLTGIGLVVREHAITRTGIRLLEITTDSVILAGVSERFVAACLPYSALVETSSAIGGQEAIQILRGQSEAPRVSSAYK